MKRPAEGAEERHRLMRRCVLCGQLYVYREEHSGACRRCAFLAAMAARGIRQDLLGARFRAAEAAMAHAEAEGLIPGSAASRAAAEAIAIASAAARAADEAAAEHAASTALAAAPAASSRPETAQDDDTMGD